MALEDGFYTLADRLTELTRQIGQGGGAAQARPETTSIEAFENAVSENFDQLQETLLEVDGGEVQQEVTLSEESVETIVTANQTQLEGSFEEAIQPEDPEEVTEEVEGAPAFNLSAEREQVQALFDELESSADITDEQLQEVAETFGEFEEKITGVSEKVEEGNLAFDQVSDKITDLADTAKEQFSEVVGNVEPAQEAINTYFQSVKDRVATQEGFLQATGEDLAQVGGVIGQIGDQQFLGNIGQTVDRLSAIASGGEAILPSQEQLQQSNSLVGAISESARNFAGNITRARVALAGLLAPLAIAADLLEDAFGVARDFRQETGIGAERMRELRSVTADVSTELAGFGLEPAAVSDVALSLVDRFGSIETATAQSGENLETLISQSGRLAGALGVSAERGAEITGTFIELENLIGGSAERGAALTNELAQARDVAPQEAFEQITSNAEQLSQFSGNTTESLAEAAVQAQQLGTSLGTVADFQEQALGDITGQVQQIQEAQMLTGQQLNATALISASYQGTEETLTEIADQLEGINFENLDFFQRQALQEAFPGFSLSELERLSRGREILEETNTTLQRAQAIAAGDLTFEQAVRADDVDEVERLRRQFNQLYFVIAENLFPIVSDLLGVITQLTPLIELIAPAVEGAAEGLRFLLSPVQLLETSFVAVKDLFYDTEGSAEALDASITSLGDTFRSLLSPIRDLTGSTIFGLFEERSKEAKESVDTFSSVIESAGILLGTYFGAKTIGSYLFGSAGSFTGAIGNATQSLRSFIPGLSKTASTAKNTGGVLSRLSGTMSTTGSATSTAAGKVSSGSSSMLASFSKLAGVSAVILSLGGGVMMLAEAAQMFAEVDGDALLATGGALAGLTTAVIGTLTAISATGVGALAMGVAAGVIATFAGSVYVLAEATETAAPAVSSLTTSLMKLATIPAGAYYKVAAGITALGGALTSLAAGGIAAGVADFFGGSTIERLSEISGMATEIQIVASSIQTLTESMQSLEDVDISSAVSQLENLSNTGALSATGEVGVQATGEAIEASGVGVQTRDSISVAQTVQGNGEMVGTVQATGEAAEAGQVGVQAEGPGVATVDQNIATGPQQAAATAQQAGAAQQTEGETQEVRLDSETDDVKGVLQEILNTQKQLLSDLRNGNIAVYLDGRKVNKELVRGLGLTN